MKPVAGHHVVKERLGADEIIGEHRTAARDTISVGGDGPDGAVAGGTAKAPRGYPMTRYANVDVIRHRAPAARHAARPDRLILPPKAIVRSRHPRRHRHPLGLQRRRAVRRDLDPQWRLLRRPVVDAVPLAALVFTLVNGFVKPILVIL